MSIGHAAFDGCSCASCVVGGQAADTLHLSPAKSEVEMKIDAKKWRGNPLASLAIHNHLLVRDTRMYKRTRGLRYEAPRVFTQETASSLLLETCDLIAFDLQINRESVHLLGEDGRCDGRAH